jgi:hypothetical protein
MSSSIIKSDNGVTSGVTGIVQTAGSDGTLLLQTTSAGGTATTAMTIDNSQKVTFASSLTPSTTAGIVGTTLGDNANAGSVGEYVASQVNAPGTGLTNNTAANATSISLTAGDWEVTGAIAFNYSAGTTVASISGGISTTSATVPNILSGYSTFFQGSITTGSNTTIPVPTIRVNVSTTTTVYLVGQCNFGGSTAGIGGFIKARRVR